jgi:hypothetical protein
LDRSREKPTSLPNGGDPFEWARKHGASAQLVDEGLSVSVWEQWQRDGVALYLKAVDVWVRIHKRIGCE